MSQFGCYTLDRMFCTCSTCPACEHRLIMEGEEKAKAHMKRVVEALVKFDTRRRSSRYVRSNPKLK